MGYGYPAGTREIKWVARRNIPLQMFNYRFIAYMKIVTSLICTVIIAQFLYAGEKHTASLPVKGMHCQSCVSMIKKTVRKVDGVQYVSVNLDSGIVVVEYDSTEALPNAVRAIRRMGYKVTDADSVMRNEHK